MLMQLPKIDVNIRPGTLDDIPFMDALQKQHSKNVGFLQRKALEGKISLGQVLIAESSNEPIGYIIAQDRYFKRDELGMICQLVVAPNRQRGLIGASLLRAQFERSAYGCRLYCCWCAQDIVANRFWEAMGFVPLAFRAGSTSKGRVHIFWQKKIRGKDDKVNWWFPAKTDQGAMREDRIVLPIPPGVHWSEVQAVRLEGSSPLLPDQSKTAARESRGPKTPPVMVRRRVQFGSPTMSPMVAEEKPKTEKAPRQKTPKQKIKADPKHIAAARELRDRYLEQVNEAGYTLESHGKYDVAKQIANSPAQKLLAA